MTEPPCFVSSIILVAAKDSDLTHRSELRCAHARKAQEHYASDSLEGSSPLRSRKHSAGKQLFYLQNT